MTRSLRGHRMVRSTRLALDCKQDWRERKEDGYKPSRFAELGDEKMKFSQAVKV